MILETMSNSIAALAALGAAEKIAALAVLAVHISALGFLRWLGRRGDTARADTAREHEPMETRDAA